MGKQGVELHRSAGLAGPTDWVDGKAACFGVHTGTGTPAYTVTMNSSHVVAGFFDGALAPERLRRNHHWLRHH